jgi:hypothetical protein
MRCDQYTENYVTKYEKLVQQGYLDMMEKCSKKQKEVEFKKQIENCVVPKIQVQTARLEEIKGYLTKCEAPKIKIEMKPLEVKDGKPISQPLRMRSKSIRRRSY